MRLLLQAVHGAGNVGLSAAQCMSRFHPVEIPIQGLGHFIDQVRIHFTAGNKHCFNSNGIDIAFHRWISFAFDGLFGIERVLFDQSFRFVGRNADQSNFMLGSEKFTLTNWNEYEFDRDATYAAGNGGKEGLNGAVALWWNATSHITTGIQYRYADDKLGEDFYQDAIIYSIKFNF